MIKAVILAGGYGSRISEETINKPKPLIQIGQKPIIWYIMNHYSKFGIKNFKVAGGYKVEMMKEYFMNIDIINSDLQISYKKKSIKYNKKFFYDWDIGVYNTGLGTQTGSRIKKLEKFLKLKNKSDFFVMTYGDGLCDIDVSKLIKFHKKHGKIATVTAVRPPARFGYLEIKKNLVKNFKEKEKSHEGWINGGYFVLSKKVFDYLDIEESCVFERKPMEKLSEDGQLMAYKHDSFWQCMDTKRDHEYLENMLKRKEEFFKND